MWRNAACLEQRLQSSNIGIIGVCVGGRRATLAAEALQRRSASAGRGRSAATGASMHQIDNADAILGWRGAGGRRQRRAAQNRFAQFDRWIGEIGGGRRLACAKDGAEAGRGRCGRRRRLMRHRERVIERAGREECAHAKPGRRAGGRGCAGRQCVGSACGVGAAGAAAFRVSARAAAQIRRRQHHVNIWHV